MKKNIHPKVHTDTQVTCACGNSFVTMSTKAKIALEICSNCHPFFTGKQKFIDTEGRIEKFERKRKQAEVQKNAKKASKNVVTTETPTKQQTLKELFQQAREDN